MGIKFLQMKVKSSAGDGTSTARWDIPQLSFPILVERKKKGTKEIATVSDT
jgi:hypothetical protein